MANPFYVEPANPLGGITTLVEQIRENSKEKQKQNVRGQMRDAVKSGNPDALADIAIENPWITDELDKFYKFKNEATKQNAIETAKNILLGGSPSQHLIDRADMVFKEGGDPSETIKLAAQAQKNPEVARKEAENILALYAPNEYRALMSGQKEDEPKQQIVDGHLVTIGPTGAVATKIEGLPGLQARGASSDYERWKQDPEGFMEFKQLTRGGSGGKSSGSNGVNSYGLDEQQTEALSRAIDNGLDPYKINSRTAKIYADQEIKVPGRKWNELGAAASFERNAGVMNSKALLNTIDPLLDELIVSGNKVTDTGSPIVNKVVHGVQKTLLPDAMGGDKVTGFDNLRDDTIAEVERGLMGTGVLSDSKYQRALENLNSAQTKKQRAEAVKNIKFVIKSRLESLANGPTGRKGEGGQQGGGPAAGPPVGTIKGGYKFNGGNPADPASWTKVQ